MVSERTRDTARCDLDYRCHFVGPSGVVEGVHLFSSPDDATATLEAMAQLRIRTRAISVELWKADRLLVRHSQLDRPS